MIQGEFKWIKQEKLLNDLELTWTYNLNTPRYNLKQITFFFLLLHNIWPHIAFFFLPLNLLDTVMEV